MAITSFGLNDPKTIKRFSVALAAQTWQKSWWGRNFMSTDGSTPLHRLSELERQAGDNVTVDLFNNLTGTGVTGDNTLKGNEEALTAYTQQFWIDQLRHGVSLGGNMSRKRIDHDVRSIAREKLSTWWARLYDEYIFTYLCGARGDQTGDWLMAPGSVTPGTTKLQANNTVTAFSSGRTIYAANSNGDGDASDSVVGNAAEDEMRLELLEYVNYKLRTMASPPRPLMIDGEECYILIMHPLAEMQLRGGTSTKWLEIQKYSERGRDMLLKNSLGKYGKLVLYSHPKIPVIDSTYGVCYNLLVGAQAGFIAHGNSGNGLHYAWHEEVDDRGNLPVIDTGAIFGIQRAMFNSVDFSSMLVKTSTKAAAVSD